MPRHLANSSLLLPVIRKVICRNGSYICSICRTEYLSKVEANNCLNQCWYDVQEIYPVVERKLGGLKKVYRCHFCCRDYPEESEALSCAKRCQGQRNQLHVREQLLNELPIKPPKHRPRRLRLVAVPTMSPSDLTQPAVDGEDADEFAADLDADIEVPGEAPAAPPRKTKASFQKPWIRMNAQYQCCYCKNLMFTKAEAETCFNKHFDAEGFEKIEP